MPVDTSRFLENFDAKDLFRAYTLAYLQKKGVAIAGVEPNIDRNWNIAAYDEGHLIKTEDNSIFTLITAPVLTTDEESTERQVVSSNLHEKFVEIIAQLIANNYAQLPSNKLKIGLCINHNNAHWTMLMANFNGLNKVEYHALFTAYQTHARRTGENQKEDGSDKEFAVKVNNIKEFIKTSKNITFNARDTTGTGEFVLGNWVLPINADNISLQHFDSLGAKTSYRDMTHASARDFVDHHHAQFQAGKAKQQTGMTCGDWSVYNSFRMGVLKKRTRIPTSEQLRELSENVSLHNADQILFEKNPDLVEPSDADRICVTQAARAQADEADEADAAKEEAAQLAGKTSLNNPYPWLHIAARVGLGALIGYFSYLLLPALFTVSFPPLMFISLSATMASALFLFDNVATRFFGEQKLVLELDNNGAPCKKEITQSAGIAHQLGINAPYHKTLGELEQEISKLLSSQAPSGDTTPKKQKKAEENRKVLTHYYAKQLIEANPDAAYDCDKAAVNQEQYVDVAKAKKLIKK